MAFQPFQNDFGRKVYSEICGVCWSGWLGQQQALINHYGLNLRDTKAREFLLDETKKYLFAGG